MSRVMGVGGSITHSAWHKYAELFPPSPFSFKLPLLECFPLLKEIFSPSHVVFQTPEEDR